MRKLVVGMLLTAATLGWAWAESFSLAGNAEVRTFQLKPGDSVQVAGNANKVTITGKGDSAQVMGNKNELHVNGEIDSVQVMGSHNKVFLNGHKAEVSDVGYKNEIIR